MATVNRRSVMALYSDPGCCESHRVRLVLAEKGIQVEVQQVAASDPVPEDVLGVNPYGSLPTLIDRDLALYGTGVINDYLDERFPHPPLMPVDPVSRAKARLALYRIETDWYGLLQALGNASSRSAVGQARKRLRESLLAGDELFAVARCFLNDEFSMLDCAVLPLLWRLGMHGIELGEQGPSVNAYAERMFRRESFMNSLSAVERDWRSIEGGV
jgi:stringent starvation protein A